MMYNNFNDGFGQGMMGGGAGWLPLFGAGFGLLLLWSVFWKGLALWHSSQHKQPWWFVALLVINTAGILEIIYLFLILKLKFSDLFSMFHKNVSPPPRA
ncbi:MAG: DUF5652 family protein [Patescibacteria group bacterium]